MEVTGIGRGTAREEKRRKVNRQRGWEGDREEYEETEHGRGTPSIHVSERVRVFVGGRHRFLSSWRNTRVVSA